MKQIAHILEDFGTPRAGSTVSAPPALSEEEIETIRLDGYESGYQAGWDDASKAMKEDQSAFSAEFARNLQDLSFTYHEAHAAVLSAIQPLLTGIIDKVVPDAARETLGLRLKEELEALVKRKSTQRVEIVVAPANVERVQDLTMQDFGFPLAVLPDDTLGEGQVFLRIGEEETEIDLAAVTEGIRQAVEGFFTEEERKIENG